jgi:hypothetical protein
MFNFSRSNQMQEYEQRLQESILTKEQLRCAISIFVNTALVLLPLYASDIPTTDKGLYFRLLVEWQKRCPRVIDYYMSEFKGGSRSQNVTGRISVHQFIKKAKEMEIFEVMMVREVAKRTVHIELPQRPLNNDHQLAASSQASARLQLGANNDEDGPGQNKQPLGYKEAEDDAFRDLNLPQMFSDAVLYKVVSQIDS